MNSNKTIATAAGLLLLVAWFAGVIGNALTAGILADPNRLGRIAANETLVTAGAFLELVMSLTCAGIAIALYPVLRKHNEGLALGAVGLRVIEGALYLVAAVCLLMLLTLGRDSAGAGASDAAFYQNSGVLLMAARDWLGPVAAVTAFGLGALMYYSVFYRARLIPRWLSGWGLVAASLTVVAGVLTMFRVFGPMSTGAIVLNIPIGVQELVLAVWLIVRGFDAAAVAAGSDAARPRAAASVATAS
jgi:hypothetical protein